MKFLSVCSGIEAASVAWGPLGWKAAGFSEIEPFPAAVLKHHYPGVINYGDMTALPDLIRMGLVDLPDVLCGGTPCQAFSVAGLRRSLDDERGNLSLVFCEIANAIDDERILAGLQPGIVFWENVPGVLSTKDNAFGCFLAGLAGEDVPLEPPGGKWTDAGAVLGPTRAVAWRVLDAQYFGLAQRRKRVFVVASARDGFDPAAILFEREGVRRDTAPSREAGKAVAPTIAGCANGGGANGPGRDVDSVESLQVVQPYAVANCLTQRMHKGINTTLDEGQTPVLAHSLCGEGFDASEDGTGRGTPLVPVGVTLHGTDGTQSVASMTEVSSSLRARIPSGVENSTTTAVLQPLVIKGAAIGRKPEAGPQYGEILQDGTVYTLNCVDQHAVLQPVTYDLFNVTAPVNRQNRQPGDPCHTLARSNAEHAAVVGAQSAVAVATAVSENGDVASTLRTGGNDHADVYNSVAVALRGRDGGATAEVGDDCAFALRASSGGGDKPHVMQPITSTDGSTHAMGCGSTQGNATVAVAFIGGVDYENNGHAADEPTGPLLKGSPTGGGRPLPAIGLPSMQVRRLTPVECERLQGFPDGYTNIPWRGKPESPDGPRYKALGNSWAVPVVRWIGQRINAHLSGAL